MSNYSDHEPQHRGYGQQPYPGDQRSLYADEASSSQRGASAYGQPSAPQHGATPHVARPEPARESSWQHADDVFSSQQQGHRGYGLPDPSLEQASYSPPLDSYGTAQDSSTNVMGSAAHTGDHQSGGRREFAPASSGSAVDSVYGDRSSGPDFQVADSPIPKPARSATEPLPFGDRTPPPGFDAVGNFQRQPEPASEERSFGRGDGYGIAQLADQDRPFDQQFSTHADFSSHSDFASQPAGDQNQHFDQHAYAPHSTSVLPVVPVPDQDSPQFDPNQQQYDHNQFDHNQYAADRRDYANPAPDYGTVPPPPTTRAPRGGHKQPNQVTAALFDFSFTHAATPLIAKYVYVGVIVLTAVGWIASVIRGFGSGVTDGLYALVFGPITAIVTIMITRLVLEFLVNASRDHAGKQQESEHDDEG